MILRARPIVIVLASAPLAVAAACGSSEGSSSSSSASGGGADAARDTGGHDPNKNCVKPGTPNNAQGIGGYCQSPEDCVPGKSLCTGATGLAPIDAWFCTRLCKDDRNCGDGLTCVEDSRGIACVPNACLALDGGTDASMGSDSAFDATTD